MLTYSLRKSNIPLYEQLYRCIKQDITEGRIPSGSNLPSKRTLAEHLKISVTTVQNAYSQLSLEGYIESRERRGYYVCSVDTARRPSPLPTIPGEMISAKISRMELIVKRILERAHRFRAR